MKISCRTQFDITATGVTGHYKPSRIPFQDQAGQHITTVAEWERARNQQRNWETVTQLISLRTQIFNVTIPQQHNHVWQFEFEVETDQLFEFDDNSVGILHMDCDGVPMIVGLDETNTRTSILKPNANIWFEVINN